MWLLSTACPTQNQTQLACCFPLCYILQALWRCTSPDSRLVQHKTQSVWCAVVDCGAATYRHPACSFLVGLVTSAPKVLLYDCIPLHNSTLQHDFITYCAFANSIATFATMLSQDSVAIGMLTVYWYVCGCTMMLSLHSGLANKLLLLSCHCDSPPCSKRCYEP